MNILSGIIFCCIFATTVVQCEDLAHMDGVLVRIVDHCTPGVDSSCPDGQCCTKEGLAYIPEATGPKPAYQISCQPYRQQGEFCYNMDTTEMCPCESSFKCVTTFGTFGHCA